MNEIARQAAIQKTVIRELLSEITMSTCKKLSVPLNTEIRLQEEQVKNDKR